MNKEKLLKLKDFILLADIAITPFIIEFSKGIHNKIKAEGNIGNRILNYGLFHITSKESAENIIKSGYIKPTKGVLNNHGTGNRAYMFAGIPDFEHYYKNLGDKQNPFITKQYDMWAVKFNIDDTELKKYRTRFQDNSITYKGYCNLKENQASLVKLVLDLDKANNIIIREAIGKEIEEYEPTEELVKTLDEQSQNLLTTGIVQYKMDRRITYTKIIEFIKSATSRKKALLPGQDKPNKIDTSKHNEFLKQIKVLPNKIKPSKESCSVKNKEEQNLLEK